MNTAIIFNIQKFSIHDGPGIRTTVFFKGCPLKCHWCANPESQDPSIQILRDRKKCTGCQTCVSACPQKAIRFTPEGFRRDPHLCIHCGACVKSCPSKALSQEGRPWTVAEVMKVVLQDRDFYEESGGGVTLSGGEVMTHPDFAAELLRELKKEHIHTALETTGFASRPVFEKVIADADLLLFDCKHWNKDQHKAGTGVSNELILENMKYAISIGKDVLPRMPIIPGYNNSHEDAAQFANLLKSIGAARAQILPFHQFGENKYHLLGRTYAYQNIKALHPEDLAQFRKIMVVNGIDAFF